MADQESFTHPHSSVEWSPNCRACPASKPPWCIEVELDTEMVQQMEDVAGFRLVE